MHIIFFEHIFVVFQVSSLSESIEAYLLYNNSKKVSCVTKVMFLEIKTSSHPKEKVSGNKEPYATFIYGLRMYVNNGSFKYYVTLKGVGGGGLEWNSLVRI